MTRGRSEMLPGRFWGASVTSTLAQLGVPRGPPGSDSTSILAWQIVKTTALTVTSSERSSNVSLRRQHILVFTFGPTGAATVELIPVQRRRNDGQVA